MLKLTKIKYLFFRNSIINIPKYLAFASVLYSSVAPLQINTAVARSYFDKPALLALAQSATAYSFQTTGQSNDIDSLSMLYGSALAGQANPFTPTKKTEVKPATTVKKPTVLASKTSYLPILGQQTVKEIRQNVTITAYSSTVDQCDSSPFITAMGSHVRDGIVAANFLKFGTKIRIPEMFGDKIFVVEDRMAKRFSNKVDIWMETRTAALQFGARRLTIEILE